MWQSTKENEFFKQQITLALSTASKAPLALCGWEHWKFNVALYCDRFILVNQNN